MVFTETIRQREQYDIANISSRDFLKFSYNFRIRIKFRKFGY